eukprot:2391253-Heterocapsa_arctica.AAC.1
MWGGDDRGVRSSLLLAPSRAGPDQPILGAISQDLVLHTLNALRASNSPPEAALGLMMARVRELHRAHEPVHRLLLAVPAGLPA